MGEYSIVHDESYKKVKKMSTDNKRARRLVQKK